MNIDVTRETLFRRIGQHRKGLARQTRKRIRLCSVAKYGQVYPISSSDEHFVNWIAHSKAPYNPNLAIWQKRDTQ